MNGIMDKVSFVVLTVLQNTFQLNFSANGCIFEHPAETEQRERLFWSPVSGYLVKAGLIFISC